MLTLSNVWKRFQKEKLKIACVEALPEMLDQFHRRIN